MNIKNVVIFIAVFFIGLGSGIVGSWFFMPSPRYNIILNTYGRAYGIPKGFFNKPNKNRWMKWEDYRARFYTNDKAN